MNDIFTIVAAILSIIGGLDILANFYLMYCRIRYKHSPSFVPIIGGLFLSIALLLFGKTAPFFWVGLLLDASIWEIIVVIIGSVIEDIKSKNDKI